MNLLKLNKTLKYRDYQGLEETLKSIEVLPISDNPDTSHTALREKFCNFLYNNSKVAPILKWEEYSSNFSKNTLGISQNVAFRTDGSLKSLSLLYVLSFKNKYKEIYTADKNKNSLFHQLSPLQYYYEYRPDELVPQLKDMFADIDTIDFSESSNIQVKYAQVLLHSTLILYKDLKKRHAQNRPIQVEIMNQLHSIIEDIIINKKIIDTDKRFSYNSLTNFYRKIFTDNNFPKLDYLEEEQAQLEKKFLFKLFHYKESVIYNKLNRMHLNKFIELGIGIALAIPGYPMYFINKKQVEKNSIILKEKIETAYQLKLEHSAYFCVLDLITSFSPQAQDKLLSIIEPTLQSEKIRSLIQEHKLTLRPEIEILLNRNILKNTIQEAPIKKKGIVKL